MKLDILVVAYRARTYLAQCLETLALHTGEGYRLTVYDNRPKNYPLTWIWNRFIEASQREFFALVNPDVLVGPRWDTESLACLEENPACSAVNPVTNWWPHRACFGKARWVPDHMEPSDVLPLNDHLQKVAASYPRFIYKPDFMIASGHCYVMRRSTWNDLGKFNENIPFAGNEDDLNKRAIARGMQMGLCSRAFVYHNWNRCVKEAAQLGELPPNTHAVRFAAPPSDGKLT
jgi:GT2 family glycosyltransferase